MLTVISWFAARKGRRDLYQIVESVLTDKPTLLAIVSDQFTSETRLRPFAPLAERFHGRLDFILAAEWLQPERERDGEMVLRRLGLSPEVRPRLLRDEGKKRVGVVLRQKQPIALIDLFFLEKGLPMDGPPDPREAIVRAEEESLAASLQDLLGRLAPLPPPPPPPMRALAPGEHDYAANGLCRLCSDGRGTVRACPGSKRDESPSRDRFQLIELD